MFNSIGSKFNSYFNFNQKDLENKEPDNKELESKVSHKNEPDNSDTSELDNSYWSNDIIKGFIEVKKMKSLIKSMEKINSENKIQLDKINARK